MPPKSKKRPGVEASIYLVDQLDQLECESSATGSAKKRKEMTASNGTAGTARRSVQTQATVQTQAQVQLWHDVDERLDQVLDVLKVSASVSTPSKSTAATTTTTTAATAAATIDRRMKQLGHDLQNGQKHQITKSELLDLIIPWKFMVGKPRNALLPLLKSNSPTLVEQTSKRAIDIARSISSISTTVAGNNNSNNNDISNAIQALTNDLKGVGPATASIILSLTRPDVFCYMYDEIIDTFLNQRNYTLKTYLHVCDQCQRLSQQLAGLAPSQQHPQQQYWTTSRVATTLWIAARLKANQIWDVLAEHQSNTTITTSNSSNNTTNSSSSSSTNNSNKKRRISNRNKPRNNNTIFY